MPFLTLTLTVVAAAAALARRVEGHNLLLAYAKLSAHSTTADCDLDHMLARWHENA